MSANTANRSYPYPQLTDDVDPPADIQALAEAIDADVQPLYDSVAAIAVRVTQSTAQTGWTTGTYNTLTFTAEDYDRGGLALHDNSTNTSRLVIGKKLGLWLVGGGFAAASNANLNNGRARITMNGSALNGALSSDPAGGNASGNVPVFNAPTIPILATVATDYVELQGLVTASSGTIGTQVNGEARSSFWALYIGS